jgi:hypothetical protein
MIQSTNYQKETQNFKIVLKEKKTMTIKYFKNKQVNIWQQRKIISIFAMQNKNMLRIRLNIESMNWFSPKGHYSVCGACMADE